MYNSEAKEYYGTFFTKTMLNAALEKLDEQHVGYKVEKEKPVFAKDRWKYKVYTDRYIWSETKGSRP